MGGFRPWGRDMARTGRGGRLLQGSDWHPDGVKGILDDEDVGEIISIVRSFNEAVGARLGVA